MEPSKLLGKIGQVIHAQCRELISRLMNFMKDEAENPNKKLSGAGIGMATYQRISKMAKEIEMGASTSFSISHKKRNRKRKVLDSMRPEDLQRLRTLIYEFYIIGKKRSTSKCKFLDQFT